MQTHLSDHIKHTEAGKEAAAILRACVHCGFCTATCPTYQILGDELDGPRGRIYLIKAVLEGEPVTEKTRTHLDRCLTCRSCETTCPSGVRYHRLLDIGREIVAQKLPRQGGDAIKRYLLRAVLPRPQLFATLFGLGRVAKPLLPAALASKIAEPSATSTAWPQTKRTRRMLVLGGCVQPTMEPGINAAAARVLDRLGIELVQAPGAGCCGAIRQHLDAPDAALDDMRRNVDAWWPYVEQGAEAVVITASGCGAQVKEYGHLLRHDAAYADKAARISALARDVGEIVLGEKAALVPLLKTDGAAKVAFHSPCTLQHGQGIRGAIEGLLAAAGYTLTPVADAHLCCGSAGTYSVLQPELSQRLRSDKLAALTHGTPEFIATANIGCLSHLKADSETQVLHWIELLERRLA